MKPLKQSACQAHLGTTRFLLTVLAGLAPNSFDSLAWRNQFENNLKLSSGVSRHLLSLRSVPSYGQVALRGARWKNWRAAESNGVLKVVKAILTPKRLAAKEIKRRAEQLAFDRFLRTARFKRN